MNYIALKLTDFMDGPGVRVALYVSGCQLAIEGHPCKNCHNRISWDKNSGSLFTEETKKTILEGLNHDYIAGFSLLGGEPFSSFNIEEEIKLLKEIKERFPNKDVWVWSGYYYDQIKNCELLKYADYLVDGPFVEELKDITLKFRGSSNQNIINLKEIRNDSDRRRNLKEN